MLFTGDLPGEQEALFMKEVPSPVSIFKNSASWLKEFYDRFILKKMVHPQKAIIVSRKK